MTEATQSASDLQLQFMNLLVTQLKNQNPLEPVDNLDMTAQLAQFTQLELTEKMNSDMNNMNETVNKLGSTFEGAMLMAEYNYGKSLLGKDITFESQAHGQAIEGHVKKLKMTPEGAVLEAEGQYQKDNGQMSETMNFDVRLGEIMSVVDKS